MTKEELREVYSEKRLALSDKERMKLDDLLLIQFQKLSFEAVHTVLSFWPMEEKGEMDTHLFTRYLSVIIPDVQICYPLIDTNSNYMAAVAVDEDTDFEENKYGITEPVNGTEIDPKKIDMMIVPLFAFDERGYRVGYGKGYYDRFITMCKPEIITVGISYFEAVDKVDDTQDFDVPLNYCITPENLYEF
jgi:5-formyltetrahydrofolate cyclo-ligase